MTAADTSIQAYRDLIDTGRLGPQKTKVLKAVYASGGATINELAHGPLAGTRNSTISGRLNGLKDDGLVFKSYKRADNHTDIESWVWEPVIK